MLNITRRDLCWPGTDPTPRTNHWEGHRVMAQAEQSPLGDYLDKIYIARLSILILSKAYLFHGIFIHVTRL
jgi:hypothetical protein